MNVLSVLNVTIVVALVVVIIIILLRSKPYSNTVRDSKPISFESNTSNPIVPVSGAPNPPSIQYSISKQGSLVVATFGQANITKISNYCAGPSDGIYIKYCDIPAGFEPSVAVYYVVYGWLQAPNANGSAGPFFLLKVDPVNKAIYLFSFGNAEGYFTPDNWLDIFGTSVSWTAAT